jgi:hypothetical protein
MLLGTALVGVMFVNVLTFQPARRTAAAASDPPAPAPATGGLLSDYVDRLQAIIGASARGTAAESPAPVEEQKGALEERPPSLRGRGGGAGGEEEQQEPPPAPPVQPQEQAQPQQPPSTDSGSSSNVIGSDVDLDAALEAAKARIQAERARAEAQQEQQQQEPEAAVVVPPAAAGDTETAAAEPEEEEEEEAAAAAASDKWELEDPTVPALQPAGAEAITRPPLSQEEPPPLHRPREEVQVQRILLTISSTDRGQRINDIWQVGPVCEIRFCMHTYIYTYILPDPSPKQKKKPKNRATSSTPSSRR